MCIIVNSHSCVAVIQCTECCPRTILGPEWIMMFITALQVKFTVEVTGNLRKWLQALRPWRLVPFSQVLMKCYILEA